MASIVFPLAFSMAILRFLGAALVSSRLIMESNTSKASSYLKYHKNQVCLFTKFL